MKSKKAQIWSMDLMVGLSLFMIAIMAFFIYSLNQPSQTRETFQLLSYDSKIISDNLLSQGYPTNWDKTNVITIGITTDNKINQTKLENLYQMVYTDGEYEKTKNLLNAEYEYYFFLENNMTVSAGSIQGIGKPGTTRESISAKDLLKTTRFTIYQNKTTPLYIYTWQE